MASGEGGDAFRRPAVAEDGRREEAGGDQGLRVLLALGDEDGGVRSRAHDGWPVVDHATRAGPENPAAVHLALGQEALAGSALGRCDLGSQFVAILPVQDAAIRQAVVEDSRQAVALAAQPGVVKGLVGMVIGVIVACRAAWRNVRRRFGIALLLMRRIVIIARPGPRRAIALCGLFVVIGGFGVDARPRIK